MLKTKAKDVAETAQKQSPAGFLQQTAKRIQDKFVLSKASTSEASEYFEGTFVERIEEEATAQCQGDEVRGATRLRYNLWFMVLSIDEADLEKGIDCSFEYTKKSCIDSVSNVAKDAIERWATESCKVTADSPVVIRGFSEMFRKDQVRDETTQFRSHHNYRGGGQWYDWALVEYEGYQEKFPVKILGIFYEMVDKEEDAEDAEEKTWLLVHETDNLTEAHREHLPYSRYDKIVKSYRLLYNVDGTPRLGVVDADTVWNNGLVIENCPGLIERVQQDDYENQIVTYVLDRAEHWPTLWSRLPY